MFAKQTSTVKRKLMKGGVAAKLGQSKAPGVAALCLLAFLLAFWKLGNQWAGGHAASEPAMTQVCPLYASPPLAFMNNIARS